jgi:ABC-type nickel/cobalt efflux system permease component RcnA
MKRTSVAVLFLLCALVLPAQEGSNPFTSSGPAPRASLVSPGSGLSGWALRLLAPIQKELNDSLAAVTQSLRGSRTLAGLLLVLGLSLAYGVFHAAGPGHGKTVVSSYFVANEPRVTQVLLVGNLIALVHALSALTVVLVLSFLVRGFLSSGVDQANGYIQKVSFGIIAVIGLYLLVQRIRGRAHQHFHPHGGEEGQQHEEGHEHGLDHPARGLRSLLVIALPAGMIPCPGAIAVIVFALSLHMFWVSVISVAAMSLGMGITISVAALLVVLAKRGALRLFSGGEQQTAVRRVVEIAGAAVLFLFGSLLFIVQF